MKIRPQILAAIMVLGGLTYGALLMDQTEVAAIAVTGIVAMATKIIEGD